MYLESIKNRQVVALKDMKVVEIPEVTSLDTVLSLDNGKKISMRNILMTMRTKSDYNTCIFSQVDQNYFGRVQACVCANEYDEASFKAEYLQIMNARSITQLQF